jgi:DNA polymerase-4
VKSRFDVYREVSNQIRAIFFEYTDLVEPLSLDEAYLDITENKMGIESAVQVAEEIRAKILATTQLTASAGVSFNKFLAKTASDINKPNGLKEISRAEAIAFLEELPVKKFHGVGKVTAEKMNRMGIYTGKDLKNLDEIELIRRFGKSGRYYYRIVRAEDNREVNPHRIRKSIGAERTFFEDLTAIPEMKAKLEYIAGVVFRHMKKSDNFGRTITLKMKTADFKIITRSKTFATEVKGLEDIIKISHELLENNQSEIDKIRLLGISVSNLAKEQESGGVQLELDFEEEE